MIKNTATYSSTLVYLTDNNSTFDARFWVQGLGLPFVETCGYVVADVKKRLRYLRLKLLSGLLNRAY